MRAQFRMQRDALVAALRREAGIALDPPLGAFYAFFHVDTDDSLALATTAAVESDVLVIPGIAFGDGGEGYLRISYASDVATIDEGIRRLAPYIRGGS
jgi:aminotransferase